MRSSIRFFHRRLLPGLLLSLLICSPALPRQPIRPLDVFPEITLTSPDSAADHDYLQLNQAQFTPRQIGADQVLVELLNVHCPHCQMQTPAYNELFKLIESDPASRGKIKLLGIAVGNQQAEVETFRRTYRVEFPIIADPQFAAWRQIGASSTPFTIYVRFDQTGPGMVNGTHQGLNTEYRAIYQKLLELAAEDPAVLRQRAVAISEKRHANPLQPPVSSTELEYRVRSAFTKFGTIMDFSELALPSGRKVYTAYLRSEQGNLRLFAEVTSRGSICDICHDVHFIYLFNRSTQIVSFEPLSLKKYGNVRWSRQEVEKMRDKVVGSYLSMPQPFDPKLDAISSATMTSAIIFDSLAQGNQLLQELRAQGLM